MVRYKIEELKNLPIEIRCTNKEQANKISKKHGYNSYWNVGYNDKEFFIKCEKDYDCPSWTSTKGYFKSQYDFKETIEFSQIDFQENLIECIEIW